MKKVLFIILSIILLNPGCHCKKESDAPGLPPATQTGANTLGFYLNGEAWVPKGFNGRPNLTWYYDPGYADGNLNISAYRFLSEANRQYFGLGGGGVTGTGTYKIVTLKSGDSKVGISFVRLIDSCEIDAYDTTIYRIGEMTITKFDTSNGIISGTFWATIYSPSCKDTLKITNGRFDLGN